MSKFLQINFWGFFCPCLESKGAFAERGMNLKGIAFVSMYEQLKRLEPVKLSSINGRQCICLQVLPPGLNPEKPID